MHGQNLWKIGRALGWRKDQIPGWTRAAFYHYSLRPSKNMSLLSRILWFLAFLVATFCWMVLFEHGFSMSAFSTGVKEELQELAAWVTRSAAESPAAPADSGSGGSVGSPAAAPAPSPPPSKP
jgi:hypothetical protein